MPRLSLVTSALFVFALLLSAPSFADTTKDTSAKQAIMVDYDTGMVLLEKNAEQKMPTSSMSKVMTMYLVFEALKEGQLRLDDTLKVSEKAWRKGGSKMFIEVGKQIKVEDLIRGVIIQSGNDATITLAEGLSGTEESFAEALTKKAKMLGMENSQFKNASGWPDPDHYSTAKDLALLAESLIREFPDYYHYYAEKEFSYNNITQRNRNPLLYRDIGADGIKTGHTEAGGYGLIGSGERNGRRVILVLNGLESAKARAQESARLLDWGLKGFQNYQLFEEGEIVASAPVVMGKKKNVPLVVKDKLVVTGPYSVRNDLKVEVRYDEPVLAPVKKGAKIGVLTLDIPRLEKMELPLYAAEDVPELGFFAATFEKIKRMATGS